VTDQILNLVTDPANWRVLLRTALLLGPVFVIVALARAGAVFVDAWLIASFPRVPVPVVTNVRRWAIRLVAMLLAFGWAHVAWPPDLVLFDLTPMETRLALAVLAPFLWDGVRLLARFAVWGLNAWRERKDLPPLPNPREIEDDLAGRTRLGQVLIQRAARAKARAAERPA
jgi:hypothetical protein